MTLDMQPLNYEDGWKNFELRTISIEQDRPNLLLTSAACCAFDCVCQLGETSIKKNFLGPCLQIALSIVSDRQKCLNSFCYRQNQIITKANKLHFHCLSSDMVWTYSR